MTVEGVQRPESCSKNTSGRKNRTRVSGRLHGDRTCSRQAQRAKLYFLAAALFSISAMSFGGKFSDREPLGLVRLRFDGWIRARNIG